MGKLKSNHPICVALRKSKNISKSLAKEFVVFLSDFDDWKKQAIYLLEDKGEKIERIVEGLFDVPIKEQASWKKAKVAAKEEVYEEKTPFDQYSKAESKDIFYAGYYPQFSFKDWKQEHGFESIPVEVGDIHTIIRFEAIYAKKDREEKFLWSFNRSRYGIRGWGNEKPIKSISRSLLDNNHNPGWVIKTLLDENKLLTDVDEKLRSGEEIPNPLILSSRDTHALLFLLLGHPFTFYGDSQIPIRNSFKKVDFRVDVHTLANHKLLAGIFYYANKDSYLPIVTEDFVDRGFILYGLPKAMVFDMKYYEILHTPIPAPMIKDSFKGVLIPNDEWDDFSQKWREWYPEEELNQLDPAKSDSPNFEARNIKDWKYWLITPEAKIDLFEKEEDITYIRLHEESKRFNTNRLALTIDNYDGEKSRLINPQASPKAHKLFQVVKSIHKGKKSEDFYSVERHSASQLLILAEEYPYALSYDGVSHMTSAENLDFRIVVLRNPDNENQYLLKGEIGQYDNKGHFVSFSQKSSYIPKAIGTIPSYILKVEQLVRIGSMISGRLINDAVSGVIVEESEVSDFYSTALPYLRQRNIIIYDPQGVLRVSALFNYKLKGKMTIWEVKGILMGRLETVMTTDIGEFQYPLELNSDEFEHTLDDKKYRIPKDLTQEGKLREELVEVGWVDEGGGDYSMRNDQCMNFVLNVLPNARSSSLIMYLGSTRLRRWKTKSLIPKISTNIKSGIDWFDVDLSVTLGGDLLNLQQLVRMWQNRENAVKLSSGDGIAVIDKDWIERYAPILNRLIKTSKTKKDELVEVEEQPQDEEDKKSLMVDKFQIGLLSELESIASERESDEEWKKLIQKASVFKGIKTKRVPKELKGVLRDYQREGVNWLCFLNDFGFGGILADDMGLGKTIQTLTFLAIIKKQRLKRPSIVIAPTSVVTNWMDEVEKFVPSLKAVLLHGQKRKEHYNAAKKSDLIITTYGLLQRDLKWLKSIKYQVIILDEAQNIKNIHSKTAKAVMELDGKRRLTLTGTPIENSISELWSQFNFLMPGFLGSIKEFERDYIRKFGKKGTNRKLVNHGLLRRQTKPFILRRLKQNVAKELPPKTEQTLFCEMYPKQRQLYDSILEVVRQQVKEKISAGGVREARIAVFDALTKLRQICCDPRLSALSGVDPPASAKFNLFVQTIGDIVREGHRVLVFSQFVKMLNLMHRELEAENIPFLQLDGSSKNRSSLVAKFQQSDIYPVFLISLKAGGTGINLTAADYVVHYDPWWNPAAEAQATDRAYRIGQKNHVFVYKLITRHSIEEKIVGLQKSKQALADNIVGASDPMEQMLNMEDLTELFSL